MLADVHYFVQLVDVETAILEIKTTNYNATDAWWQDSREAVPPYYEAQGRHPSVSMVNPFWYLCST